MALDVIDDCSRVWVAPHACPAETIETALGAMDAADTGWGLPGLVLCDNGAAFAHPHPHRYRDKTLSSHFSRTLAAKGTRVIHSSPYHPPTCGKCERLHPTAAKLLTHFSPEPPASIAELQTRLDTVRAHYNTIRRHSAIGRIPPQRAWQNALTHGGPADLPRQTDATVHVLTVLTNGTLTLGNHILYLGRPHRHHPHPAAQRRPRHRLRPPRRAPRPPRDRPRPPLPRQAHPAPHAMTTHPQQDHTHCDTCPKTNP